MAAAGLQTAAMPPPLRPETDRSSYTNQPPTWQLHAFRQLPPGLRKPSKEHFLIFHRYSTELFRGWTCLLDFCKLLANMGLWKIVNVSAFGKPDASKIRNVSGFCKNQCSTQRDYSRVNDDRLHMHRHDYLHVPIECTCRWMCP